MSSESVAKRLSQARGRGAARNSAGSASRESAPKRGNLMCGRTVALKATRTAFKGSVGLPAPSQRRKRKRRAAAEDAVTDAAAAGDGSVQPFNAHESTARESVILERLRQVTVGNILLAQPVGLEATEAPLNLEVIRQGWQLQTHDGRIALVIRVLGGGCTSAWGQKVAFLSLTLAHRAAPNQDLYDPAGKSTLQRASIQDAGAFVRFDAAARCYRLLPPGAEFRLSRDSVERREMVVALSASPFLQVLQDFVQEGDEIVKPLPVEPLHALTQHAGHSLQKNGDKSVVFVYDVSGPVTLLTKQMRCITCDGKRLYATGEDIRRVVPGAIRYNDSGSRNAIWHTIEWLLMRWIDFALDPHHVHAYLDMVKAWGSKILEKAFTSAVPANAPQWSLGTLPSSDALNDMLLTFAECFLPELVDAVEDDILELDGDDFATDGNRKIARLIVDDKAKPFGMVIASAGGSGFLHGPGVLAAEEDNNAYKCMLHKRFIKRRRRLQGRHSRDGQPRNIITDAPNTYGAGFLETVEEVWKDRIDASSPCASAQHQHTQAEREAEKEERIGTRIVKDVQHTDLNFESVVRHGHPDSRDGRSSHSDLMVIALAVLAGWLAVCWSLRWRGRRGTRGEPPSPGPQELPFVED